MEVTVKNLTKKYKEIKALDTINLKIGSGMFGLLGPNGAGKTTMMKIIATLIEPTEGEIFFNGYNIYKHRKEIRNVLGYLPQEFNAYPSLTAIEVLDYIASLNGLKGKEKKTEIDNILQITNLDNVRDRRVKTFSGGMIRRLGIAQALVGSPQLIIVDEPTTGLDPEERIKFRNFLSEISGDRVVVLSTHIVGDISSTCEDLAVLNKGKIVYQSEPDKLMDLAKGRTWKVIIPQEKLGEVKDRASIISMIVNHNHLELRVVADDVSGFNAEPIEPTLEDAYIYLMGVKLGEAWDVDVVN